MPKPLSPHRPRVLTTRLAVALVAGLLLAGCTAPTDEPAPQASASETTNLIADPGMRNVEVPDCLPEGTAAAAIGPEDDPTLVAWSGSGTKGVVLAPQDGAGPCQWADQLTRLVGEGYLVATFSWSQDGAGSLLGAVDVLKTVGAQDVALVGASKGGAFAAAFADEVDPVTVVALGPPAEFEGTDASSQASTYTGPLLVIASTDDQNVSIDSSRLVARADDPNTLVELPGAAHGVELFNGDHKLHIEGEIDNALVAGFAG